MDVEVAVISACLKDKNARKVATQLLSPEDFSEKNKSIYQILSEGTDDIVIIADMLEKQGELEKIGGYQYLSYILDVVSNPANIEEYIELMKKKKTLQKIISSSYRAISEAEQNRDVEEIIAELEESLREKELFIAKPVADIADEIEHDVLEKQTGGDFLGYDTGFTHLNRVINGFNKGLYVIGGSPSSGKTTLALQIALNVATLNEGVNVAYFSLDQSAEDLHIRTLSRLSGIENRDIFRGRLEQGTEEMEKLLKAFEEYREIGKNFYLLGPSYDFSVEKMKSLCSEGKWFVVIDYLQKVYPKMRYYSEYERMNLVINKLIQAGDEISAPILLVSEVARAGYGKKSMKVFKDSGRIEYGSDVAGILVDDNFGGNPREVSLYILKNRNGEKARIKFDFWVTFSKFEEISSEKFESPEDIIG